MELSTLTTFNLSILVLFLGKLFNQRFEILRRFNIPELVSSGLLICLITFALYLVTGLEVSFSMGARDVLLVYFLAGIGLNSDMRSLLAGGIPLVILLLATVAFMFIQNFAGAGTATLLGLDAPVGLLGGTTSLVGGHGTAIAWTPVYRDDYGIVNASEIGVACATFGLVLASRLRCQPPNRLDRPHHPDPPDYGLRRVTHASLRQPPPLRPVRIVSAAGS